MTPLIHDRDGGRCVRDGAVLSPQPGSYSEHHRILGNRADNRPSNKLSLCGSGTTGCHGWVHAHPREAREKGWIVTRHGPRDATRTVPVWYSQPGLRTGWYLLGDDGSLEPWTRGEDL